MVVAVEVGDTEGGREDPLHLHLLGVYHWGWGSWWGWASWWRNWRGRWRWWG